MKLWVFSTHLVSVPVNNFRFVTRRETKVTTIDISVISVELKNWVDFCFVFQAIKKNQNKYYFQKQVGFLESDRWRKHNSVSRK